MKASVFIGMSVDGFIARAKGELDFLPPGGGEPHGYDEFIATVDALVIGRNTFEAVLTFDTWAYAKPVFVLSTHPLATLRWARRWSACRELRRTSCRS
jgi:dihydrofolate reductase